MEGLVSENLAIQNYLHIGGDIFYRSLGEGWKATIILRCERKSTQQQHHKLHAAPICPKIDASGDIYISTF